MTEADFTFPTPYLWIASMDVHPEHEALFNEVYDTEHIPALAQVPGVRGVARFERVDAEMAIAGTIQPVPHTQPRFHALYMLESPEVMVSDPWAKAVEAGRWPAQVRPHTTNRRHVLAKAMPAQPPRK